MTISKTSKDLTVHVQKSYIYSHIAQKFCLQELISNNVCTSEIDKHLIYSKIKDLIYDCECIDTYIYGIENICPQNISQLSANDLLLRKKNGSSLCWFVENYFILY